MFREDTNHGEECKYRSPHYKGINSRRVAGGDCFENILLIIYENFLAKTAWVSGGLTSNNEPVLAITDIIAIMKGVKFFLGIGRKLRMYYICIIKSNYSLRLFANTDAR